MFLFYTWMHRASLVNMIVWQLKPMGYPQSFLLSILVKYGQKKKVKYGFEYCIPITWADLGQKCTKLVLQLFATTK